MTAIAPRLRGRVRRAGPRASPRAVVIAALTGAMLIPATAATEAGASGNPIKFLRYEYRVINLEGSASVSWVDRGGQCRTPYEGVSAVAFAPDPSALAPLAPEGILTVRLRRGRIVFGGGAIGTNVLYARDTRVNWQEATDPGCTTFVPRSCESTFAGDGRRAAGLFVRPRRARAVTPSVPVGLAWTLLPDVGVGGHGSDDPCRAKGPLLTSTFDEPTEDPLRRYGGVWHSWRVFGREATLKREGRCARKQFRQRFRNRNRRTGGRCVRIVRLNHRGTAPIDHLDWDGSYRWNMRAVLWVSKRTVRR